MRDRRPYTAVIGMNAKVVRADGSSINFGDAVYHPENVEEARQYAASSEPASTGLDSLMLHYFESRGSAIPVITTGEKAIEEARELVEAIASEDREHIWEEVADLALVAAVVARQYDATVEACIALKAERDAGRGEPKQDARLSVSSPQDPA